MKSTEKVQIALDRVENLADDPEAPLDLKMAGAMVAGGRPLIEKFIPDNHVDLDELLCRGADWMHSLISDQEPPAELEPGT